jgi:hypothetical protein
MSLPSLDELRPHPDALTRQELADAIGEDYHRVYWWTARRQPPVVTPSYGEGSGQGHPAWFSPDDLERLRDFLTALNTVQSYTGSRTPRAGRKRAGGGS